MIWNPYGEDKMGYKNFVCIENAVVGEEVCLPPGEVRSPSVWMCMYVCTCICGAMYKEQFQIPVACFTYVCVQVLNLPKSG